MPKYTFLCSCGKKTQKFVELSITQLKCPNCDSIMERQLPGLLGKTQVNETVDTHTGVKWVDDHEKITKDRKRTYFWSVEVPRLVDSGVYSLQTMLENKWVYYNEKGELVTRTNPPESE